MYFPTVNLRYPARNLPLNYLYKFDTIDIEKGTTDRRLVTNILVKKVTKPFADGGYFFKLFIYSISMITIIEIIINTMYKISYSSISSNFKPYSMA